MININLTFEEKIGKRLQNAKEEAKINGECSNWEEFIIMCCLEQKAKGFTIDKKHYPSLRKCLGKKK